LAEKGELDKIRNILESVTLSPSVARRFGLDVNLDGARRSLFEVLSRPGVRFEDLISISPDLSLASHSIRRRIESDAIYAVYVDRQKEDIEATERDERVRFPNNFSFDQVSGLSNELKARLAKHPPASLGQAKAMEGMTPAAITLLRASLRQQKIAGS